MTFIRLGNIVWLALLLMLLSLLAYFYFQTLFLAHEPPPTINQPSVEFKGKTLEVRRTEAIPGGNTINQHITPPISDIQQHLITDITPGDREEIEQWYRDRGKFWDAPDTEYKDYDEFTLKKLADTGDLQALNALADMYVDEKHFNREGYGFEARNDLFWKAAVYGSTDALHRIANIMQNTNYSSTSHEPENRKYALEILSLYNTIALRGDEMSSIVDADLFKFSNNITLSDEEEKFVEQRSQEIYNQLLQKRIALGLGDFDNSQPESLKRYFINMRETARLNKHLRQ